MKLHSKHIDFWLPFLSPGIRALHNEAFFWKPLLPRSIIVPLWVRNKMWFFEIFKMKIGYPSWRSKVSPSARAEQNTNFWVSNRNMVLFILKLTTMKKYAQNWKNFTNRSSGSDFRDHYVNPIWPPICIFRNISFFFKNLIET